jgi:hypothetical protein
MIHNILLTAGVVLAAAIVLGIGWWPADRRARTRLADLRTTLTAQINFAYAAYDTANGIAAELEGMVAEARADLAAMTEERDAYRDAHHRSAEEFERLLERHRAVPVAFRADLGQLDRATEPPLLYEPWRMPRPDADASEALRLAALAGTNTGAWKRVMYRPVAPAVVDDVVHEGEVLPRAGRALVAVRDYPAKKQRKKRGKR